MKISKEISERICGMFSYTSGAFGPKEPVFYAIKVDKSQLVMESISTSQINAENSKPHHWWLALGDRAEVVKLALVETKIPA